MNSGVILKRQKHILWERKARMGFNVNSAGCDPVDIEY